MKYPIFIILSVAQHRLFTDDIRDGVNSGDCKLRGYKLTMDDYEGAGAMVGRFQRREHPTKREFLSWYSVVGRMHDAIAAAATGGARA